MTFLSGLSGPMRYLPSPPLAGGAERLAVASTDGAVGRDPRFPLPVVLLHAIHANALEAVDSQTHRAPLVSFNGAGIAG